MVAVHNFLCTYRTLCLYLCSTVQPKIYEFYSTLIHRAGVVGNFVQFHAEFVYTFQIFVSSNFCGITALKIWRIFSSYSSHDVSGNRCKARSHLWPVKLEKTSKAINSWSKQTYSSLSLKDFNFFVRSFI